MAQPAPDETSQLVNDSSLGVRPHITGQMNGQTFTKASLGTVGRRDVQVIFGLIAVSILLFGLVPFVTDFLRTGHEQEAEADLAIAPIFQVDINSASATELALLPQVGQVLAERIVAERIAGGPYRSVDELKRTRGVGVERIQRLRHLLVAKPAASQRDQLTYRAAKMPTDYEHADLIVTPHSERLFKEPATGR
jgi:hypothetical protein